MKIIYEIASVSQTFTPIIERKGDLESHYLYGLFGYYALGLRGFKHSFLYHSFKAVCKKALLHQHFKSRANAP